MSPAAGSAGGPGGRPPMVVVVGGGLAGASAALRAADAGARVVLLERRLRLGGMATSWVRDGLEIDNGQHVFLRCCTAYQQHVRRLGASDMVEVQPRLDVPVLVAHPGSPLRWTRLRRSALPLPPPLHLAGGLLTYRGLTAAGRLRAAATAAALGSVDPDDLSADAVTFGAWLAARGVDTRSVQGLWELLTVATLNAPVEEASLALAARVVRTGLLENTDGADIGRAVVPLGRVHHDATMRALERAGVTVHLGTPVRALLHGCGEESARADGRCGEWAVVTDDGALTADAVVLAVPPEAAAGLLPAGALPAHEPLRELGTSPIVNLHLFYDRPVLRTPFVAVVGSPVQWVFDRTAAAGVGHGQYLAVSLSAATQWIDEPVSRLRSLFEHEMGRLLLGARAGQLTQMIVTRERSATFRQVAGSGRLRPRTATALPGLALAGAWTATGWPATMEGAVRSGWSAADHVLTGLTTDGRRPDPEVVTV